MKKVKIHLDMNLKGVILLGPACTGKSLMQRWLFPSHITLQDLPVCPQSIDLFRTYLKKGFASISLIDTTQNIRFAREIQRKLKGIVIFHIAGVELPKRKAKR